MPTEDVHLQETRKAMKRSLVLELAGLIGILALSVAGAGPSEKPAASPGGSWGGIGILVDIGPSSVRIELDGAQGRIGAPLALDGTGRFDVEGTIVHERPGPTRQGEAEPAREPARFQGVVEGDTLTLTVTLIRSGKVIGPLTAKRGAPARVRKMA